MNKYLQIFKISYSQEFAYRLNFVMWRVRNIFQIFLVFFLWDAIFSDPNRVLFGYDRTKILTYVFGLLIIRALVLSSRSSEVAGEVANGNISNFLIKPVSYFKYWMARDASTKLLNIGFATVETIILFLILRPPFFIQTNPIYLLFFLIAIALAMATLFVMHFITGSVPFWAPEAAWGVNFLFIFIVVEFLSGALFPLDVLPSNLQEILSFTPFPYLIYFPLQVYLGNVAVPEIIKGIVVAVVWLLILWLIMKFVWRKGLKAYQVYGR